MLTGKFRRIIALTLAVIMISVPTMPAFALKAGDAIVEADETMLTAGLVQDKTGNFYSMEMDPHNQHYGMLRYKSGYYDCGGQQIYLELEENNISSLGAIKNADAIEKLKSIYGLTTYPVGNETATYTSKL